MGRGMGRMLNNNRVRARVRARVRIFKNKQVRVRMIESITYRLGLGLVPGSGSDLGL